MRHRIEDLGRLLVLLEALAKDSFFEDPIRPKDFTDWFDKRSATDKGDILHAMAYGKRRVHELLAECIVIARGHDDLQENTK